MESWFTVYNACSHLIVHPALLDVRGIGWGAEFSLSFILFYA